MSFNFNIDINVNGFVLYTVWVQIKKKLNITKHFVDLINKLIAFNILRYFAIRSVGTTSF